MMSMRKFYKVIVVRVDVFESEIMDERHFSELKDAASFCDVMKSTPGMSALLIEM